MQSLCTLSHAESLHNIIGIELLNEPDPPSDAVLMRWYLDAMKALSAGDGGIPIYLGECWRTGVYADFISKNSVHGMIVLDHHFYRCFTAEDIRTSAEDLTRSILDPNGISHTLENASEKIGHAGGGVVIGEWSGALNPGSLKGVQANANNAQRRYVDAQLEMFERCCAGWFFWTYKKEHKGDTGWSLRDAVECGVFPPFVGEKALGVRDILGDADRSEERNTVKDRAIGEHACQ